ncbi:MAG: hypothetical protein U0Y82_13630 [Thermoleophilia bacterium]
MRTHRSTAFRRLGLTIVPAALAAMAFAGTASANGPTCVAPSDVIAFSNNVTLPVCKPDLELSKQGPATITPGMVTWKIIVWHAGYPGAADPIGATVGIPLSAIHVNDPALGAFDIKPDPDYGVPADGMLYPNRAVVYTVQQRFTAKICAKASVSNTADMTVDVAQSDTSNDTDTISVPVSCTADLAISKVANSASYAPGDPMKWTVTVTNTGNSDVPVSRIKVDDNGASLTPAAGNPGDVLAPGGTMSYQATSDAAASACGTVSNTATVALTGAGAVDANAGNNSATATTQVNGGTCATTPPVEQLTGSPSPATITGTPQPAVCPKTVVRVVIAAARRPFAGQVSTVGLAVTARTDAQNVRLTYRLPAGYVVDSRPANVRMRHGVVIVNFGTLSKGTTKHLTLGVHLLRSAVGRRQHAASVSATCATSASATLPASVRPLVSGVKPAVTG